MLIWQDAWWSLDTRRACGQTPLDFDCMNVRGATPFSVTPGAELRLRLVHKGMT